MASDSELLHQYAAQGSEAAFAEVVRRHVNLVYASAVRLLNGNAALAEDVTQTVFTDLARKAASLSGHSTVAGWLHTSVRFAASKAVRDEQCRRMREQEASTMTDQTTTADISWMQLRPLIDEAVGQLGQTERDAVLLRFFEDKSHREVGAALGLSENAARMRIERAMEKLRRYFAQRGVTASVALLASTLGAKAASVTAPSAFAAGLSGKVMASVAAGGASGAVAASAWKTFFGTKLGTAAAVMLAGTAVYTAAYFFSAMSEKSAPFNAKANSSSGLTNLSTNLKTSPSTTNPTDNMKPSQIISTAAFATTMLVSSVAPAADTTTNPTPPPATSGTPARNGTVVAGNPTGKFLPGDTLTARFNAVNDDLKTTLDALNKAPSAIHGGFVEKAVADVNQTLTDVTKALDYVQLHPELEPVSAWAADDSNHGRMPTPMPSLPNYAGYNVMRGGVMSVVNRGPTVEDNMIAAFSDLRLAYGEFNNVHPEMKPYEIGDVGGNRDIIRADLAKVATDIINGLDIAHAPKALVSPDGELLVNGNFDALPTPTNGNIPARNFMLSYQDGMEAVGFGWRVVTVNSFQKGTAMVAHQGYTNAAQGVSFTAPAADGQQWLVLNCNSAPMEGSSAIAQIIPTVAGKQYTLTFAYANSPCVITALPTGEVFNPVHPYTATATVKDAVSEENLITPFEFSHNTATMDDYHWEHAKPITFTAKSAHTTIQFTSTTKSRSTDSIFLDNISVKPAVAATP